MISLNSEYAKFFPMQLRGPAEKGLKDALLSWSNLWSYNSWVDGSQRSGLKAKGSTQFWEEW
jgi:hypothetical protein